MTTDSTKGPALYSGVISDGAQGLFVIPGWKQPYGQNSSYKISILYDTSCPISPPHYGLF